MAAGLPQPDPRPVLRLPLEPGTGQEGAVAAHTRPGCLLATRERDADDLMREASCRYAGD